MERYVKNSSLKRPSVKNSRLVNKELNLDDRETTETTGCQHSLSDNDNSKIV